MRRILWTTAAVLGLAMSANAQPAPTGQDMKCPLDGSLFQAPLGDPGDRSGGADSDECPHPMTSNPLAYIVVVCPRCNYASLSNTFATAIPDAKRPDLLRVLAKSKYRDVADPMTEIPLWERYRLASQCARVLDRPDERVATLKFAVWSARIEACRPGTLEVCRPVDVGNAVGVPGFTRSQAVTHLAQRDSEGFPTRAVDDALRDLDRKIAAAPKPEDKDRLTLALAMMDERAGYPAKRDAAVAKLGEAAASDPSIAAPLARFKKLIEAEQSFQSQLADELKDRIAKDADRRAKAADGYLLADGLRRLGRDKEAVAEYRAARKLMSQPSDMRIYTDYFLTMLAPGEPLPVAESEKAPEPGTPQFAPTPEKPATNAPQTPVGEKK